MPSLYRLSESKSSWLLRGELGLGRRGDGLTIVSQQDRVWHLRRGKRGQGDDGRCRREARLLQPSYWARSRTDGAALVGDPRAKRTAHILEHA